MSRVDGGKCRSTVAVRPDQDGALVPEAVPAGEPAVVDQVRPGRERPDRSPARRQHSRSGPPALRPASGHQGEPAVEQVECADRPSVVEHRDVRARAPGTAGVRASIASAEVVFEAAGAARRAAAAQRAQHVLPADGPPLRLVAVQQGVAQAIRQPRLWRAGTAVFIPVPPIGVMRCAASPTRKRSRRGTPVPVAGRGGGGDQAGRPGTGDENVVVGLCHRGLRARLWCAGTARGRRPDGASVKPTDPAGDCPCRAIRDLRGA
jgi:hypothetical protein